jgi:hypothetical protein
MIIGLITQEGFLSHLILDTGKVKLYTANLLWISEEERNVRVEAFFQFAEQIGSSNVQVIRKMVSEL